LKHNLVTAISLTVFVLCSVIFWESGYVEFVLGTIAIIYLALTAYGSYRIDANYFIKSINRGRNKTISLTFDDGPDPNYTPAILSILRESNVKGTFFVIGKKAERYPDLLRQIHAEGHIIANHSYNHSYFIGFFSTTRLTRDLARCNDIITQTIGCRPVFFRPPFGVTNPNYAGALKANGLISVGWSLRSMDTLAKNKYQLIDNVISKLKRRDIVLLHDHLPVTASALTDIIEHCNNKRLPPAPLPQLLNLEPYAKI
jgi:peptidoglycan/xylan/chitin deacetylase (PgdA/CDA1 family)